MHLVCWNVNSVKSRLNHLIKLIDELSPDVILLQELKCLDEAFPNMEIEEKGYNIATSGQKTYNGVAILSKYPVEDVNKSLPGDESDAQARYIEAFTGGKRICSVYVPNGQSVGSDKFEYKLAFLDRLHNHIANLLKYDEELVIGGDYNIAPEEIDVYNPKNLDGEVCFTIDERKKFRKLLNLGISDSFRAMHPEKHDYSWWDYRAGSWEQNKGLRIDQILLSAEATDNLLEAGIYSEFRSYPKASDHAPIFCKFNK